MVEASQGHLRGRWAGLLATFRRHRGEHLRVSKPIEVKHLNAATATAASRHAHGGPADGRPDTPSCRESHPVAGLVADPRQRPVLPRQEICARIAQTVVP
jgi:hypothetical protein